MDKHIKVKYSNNKNSIGVSLIVLVITIIIILILASAIVITVSHSNPISGAYNAKYENDRDNIQSVLTNTIGKIITETRGSVTVIPGVINDVKSDVKKTSGQISYTVTNSVNKKSAKGMIIFAKGDNTDTEYYTGYQLPIYGAAKTEWYVDEKGKVSLKVGETVYGSDTWISED